MATWQEELAENLSKLSQSNPTMAAQAGVTRPVSTGDVQRSYESGGSVSGNTTIVQPQPYYPIDYSNQIKELTEYQRQRQIAALDKSRNAALSNLAAERAQIQPQYYQKRNDASVQSKLGAQTFAEYIAARGLKNSGENTQAQIAQNVALQGQLGALKQQEQQAYNDIARRESDINNAYQSDLAAAEAGLNASEMQGLIDEWRRLDNMRYQAGQDSINNNIRYQQLAMQQEAANLDNDIKRLQLQNLPEQSKLELERARFELEQAKELAKYAPEEAQLKLQQIKAQIAATNRSNREKPDEGPYYRALAAGQDEINRLISAGQIPSPEEQQQIMNKWLAWFGLTNQASNLYSDEELSSIL